MAAAGYHAVNVYPSKYGNISTLGATPSDSQQNHQRQMVM